MLSKRVRDGVLLRLIGKWLNAGVLEGGVVSHADFGTPQGGVISPLLANVFLGEVLDAWFEDVVRPRLGGRAMLVRYADDAVMVFANERDARRVWDALPKRLGRYGLTLHAGKTRLVEFQRPVRGTADGEGREDRHAVHTFDCLGFRHYWGRTRRGEWAVKQKTASDRMSRALRAIGMWCRRYRHAPVAWQHEQLVRKLRGHYQYFGITGNSHAIWRFRYEVRGRWRRWLNRRAAREHMPWSRFLLLEQHYPLPRAIAVRSTLRYAANP